MPKRGPLKVLNMVMCRGHEPGGRELLFSGHSPLPSLSKVSVNAPLLSRSQVLENFLFFSPVLSSLDPPGGYSTLSWVRMCGPKF